MSSPTLVNLSSLIDDAKCFELVRQHRWPEGVRCPSCGSSSVARHGRDDTQPHRQRYRCAACSARFDDLTGTVLAGHHQPLRVWVLCLYLMGLNLSNRQIAEELGLAGSDAQLMTEQLRHGLAARLPAPRLEGEVEIDEVYVVAGHKGQPAAVAKRGARDGVAGWRERRAAARWKRTSHRSSA
jgi:transposase-like protein